MMHRSRPRVLYRIGVAMVCSLAPVSAWSKEESLPGAADGQEVIVSRIGGLPLSHGLDGVYPDYRECVRVDTFDSQGDEKLDVLGTAHYEMRIRLTVTDLADCQWQLSYFAHHDRKAFVRALEEGAAAATVQSTTGGVSETATRYAQELCMPSSGSAFDHLNYRGRDASCPAPPAQIRAGALAHSAPTSDV